MLVDAHLIDAPRESSLIYQCLQFLDPSKAQHTKARVRFQNCKVPATSSEAFNIISNIE
jgi:hypothetical protein